MTTSIEFRKAFAERLVLACERNPNIPPVGQGRQQVIADKLGVAPEAVSKWFKAKSMPRRQKMIELAAFLGVELSWLDKGEDPEFTRIERVRIRNQSTGAEHLVWGLVSLAGGHCGQLPQNDPRSHYVHFVATISGTAHPIHVTLAREVSPNKFEVLIPSEFEEVRIICVVPIGAGKFHYLDLETPEVDRHKSPKGGDYAISLQKNAAGKYTTGDTTWAKIRSFATFSDYES